MVPSCAQATDTLASMLPAWSGVHDSEQDLRGCRQVIRTGPNCRRCGRLWTGCLPTSCSQVSGRKSCPACILQGCMSRYQQGLTLRHASPGLVMLMQRPPSPGLITASGISTVSKVQLTILQTSFRGRTHSVSDQVQIGLIMLCVKDCISGLTACGMHRLPHVLCHKLQHGVICQWFQCHCYQTIVSILYRQRGGCTATTARRLPAACCVVLAVRQPTGAHAPCAR